LHQLLKFKFLFLNPKNLVEELEVDLGWEVADFGCGSGSITIELARAVGADGKVSALDVMVPPLESVASSARALGLKNIKMIQANLEVEGSSTLKDESQDLVVLANILFQSDERQAIIKEAKRVLSPGGLLVVIDWKKNKSTKLGPSLDNLVNPFELREMVGLPFERELRSTGTYHFGLVFKKE